MKSPLKFVLPFLSLGLAAAPALLAEDAAPPPPAPAESAAPAPANPPAPEQGGDQAPPPPRRHHRGDPLKMLTEKLSLTADQQGKVGDILKGQREQMQAIHEDDTLSDDDKRAKFRALMKSSHDAIRALLTPDQQKAFDALPPMRERGPRKSDDN